MVAKGVALRRAGHDAEALVEFQHALAIEDTPRVRAQIALAEQALGLWAPAEQHLLEAMGHANDPWIEKNRITLIGALDIIQSHLGVLDVWGGPAGAVLLVDMKVVGHLPLKSPLRVSGDSVLLTVRAPGFIETTRTVRVVAGGKVREHVDLIPSGSTASSSMGGPRADISKPDQVPVLSSTSGSSTERGSRLRPAAWAAAVLAAGGLVLGIVETKLAVDRQDAFNDHTGPDPSNPARTVKDCSTTVEPAACVPLERDYNSSVRLAIIGYSLAGILAIGSAVMFALSSQSPAASASIARGCGLQLRNPGAFCTLVF